MWDSATERVASIGCCAEIIQHHRLSDGRMKMLTLGQQRFRVLEYVREKPYYVGLVQWIEDEPPETDLREKAVEVKKLLEDVVHLSAKLTDEDIELPDGIPDLPLELSYWIASNLYRAPSEQQALLEMQSTQERLEREADILMTTRNNLAARSALKDAFSDNTETR